MADNKSFFTRLKKLFSQNAVITVDKDGNRNVVDVDERQITNLSHLRDRYTKIQRSFYEQSGQGMSMAYQQIRRELFRDYDSMDQDPIIASALDIYADESTTLNEYGDILQINAPNEKVRESLENLFYDILNVEFNLWPWTRNLCKYGDFFLGLEIAEGAGIVNVRPLSHYMTERLENTDSSNPNYVKFKVEDDPYGRGEYENFEVAHFRLLSDTNFLPYGKSMIENGRRLWKQLTLMEDAMLIHRIMRAPEKRVFKIDIGNIPPAEVDNYMQAIINKMKKVPFVDRKSGDYNLKYNMQNITEDFYLPVRGGDSGTEIDNLRGLEYMAIEDIDYLKNKLFAALKIPRAYLGYEENVSGKATLAAEDVRFARTIERIQRIIVSELTKIAIIHLYAIGIDDAEMTNFELKLTNASTIYEQEKIQLWSEKVRLADDMQRAKMFSTDWIYENVFGFSDDEIDVERAKLVLDLKSRFRYDQIEQMGEDPAAPDPQPTDVEEELQGIKHELSNGRYKDKGGRPKEGGNYGSEEHPYGRDPLGDKENHSKRKREKRDHTPANTKLAREFKRKYKKTPEILKERFSMLNEENIIDDINDENN